MIAEFADEKAAGRSFHERNDAMLASGAGYGVHLPVAELSAVFNSSGSLGNVSFSGHFAAFFVRTVALSIPRALAQVSVESSAVSFVAPDVLVDGFVAHLKQSVPAEGAADLLGAEVCLDEFFDKLPVLITQMALPPRAPAS